MSKFSNLDIDLHDNSSEFAAIMRYHNLSREQTADMTGLSVSAIKSYQRHPLKRDGTRNNNRRVCSAWALRLLIDRVEQL